MKTDRITDSSDIKVKMCLQPLSVENGVISKGEGLKSGKPFGLFLGAEVFTGRQSL